MADTRGPGTRTKARKRALDILFEADLREEDVLETLHERVSDAEPPVRDFTAQIVAGSQPIRVIWRIRQMMPAKGRPMVKNVSHGRIKAISKRMFSLSIGLMKIYPLIGHESI